ncbi:MAG: Transposase IS200 like [Glomeribacter sp. 1016415]|nr:Transposase IS200 like [Glomeribacter sp. 1016415]
MFLAYWFTYPPNMSESALVNGLKGLPIEGSKETTLTSRNNPTRSSLAMSSSYFAASCSGTPISIVRQYIEQHATHN